LRTIWTDETILESSIAYEAEENDKEINVRIKDSSVKEHFIAEVPEYSSVKLHFPGHIQHQIKENIDSKLKSDIMDIK
jgi:hypothetical protein